MRAANCYVVVICHPSLPVPIIDAVTEHDCAVPNDADWQRWVVARHRHAMQEAIEDAVRWLLVGMDSLRGETVQVSVRTVFGTQGPFAWNVGGAEGGWVPEQETTREALPVTLPNRHELVPARFPFRDGQRLYWINPKWRQDGTPLTAHAVFVQRDLLFLAAEGEVLVVWNGFDHTVKIQELWDTP